MSKTLEQHLERLAEELEDNPDSWFNNPNGYLRKPRFSRPAQDRSNVLKRTMFTNVLGSSYQLRYFVLNHSTQKLSYYESHDTKSTERGFIDLNIITDMAYSQVFDAPEFSIDLISSDRHYTLVADSHSVILRWAFAINMSLPNPKQAGQIDFDVVFDANRGCNESVQSNSLVALPSDKFFEYKVEYQEEGPLMINVAGVVCRDREERLLSHLVTVTSFENYPDGSPGISELTGIICVKDCIIGVNGVDLKALTFNEALNQIAQASWPKSLYFQRNNTLARTATRAEGWATVYYPALNRRRRRYIELVHDIINFKKMEPGGAATNARDAFFRISQVQLIRPVIDKTVPTEQQFTLHLECEADSIINHVDEDDVSSGGTFVESLQICFANSSHFNRWRSALVSPLSLSDGTHLMLQATPMETVESVQPEEGAMATRLAIMMEVTGFFAPREFSLEKGTLRWRRVTELKGRERGKGRSLFIGNATSCALIRLRTIKDPCKDISGYEYQLVIQTNESTVVMGMHDEMTLALWMGALRDTALLAPPASRTNLVLPSALELVHLGNSIRTGFLSNSKSEESNSSGFPIATNNTVTSNTSTPSSSAFSTGTKGYLYLRIERQDKRFNKYWCVLFNYEIAYYRSEHEARNPAGCIDLREAYAINEAVNSKLPENSIEILCVNRSIILVAEDEGDQLRWLDILADKLEERKVAALREDIFLQTSGLPRSAKVERMKRLVQFSGCLMKKNGNIWRERYFVLANRSLTYYSTEDRFYDDHKDSLGCIPIANIVRVCSSSVDKCRGSGFDVHAYAQKGTRDALGVRIYTLDARLDSLCREWMSVLCEALDMRLDCVSQPGQPEKYVSAPVDRSQSRTVTAVPTHIDFSKVSSSTQKPGNRAVNATNPITERSIPKIEILSSAKPSDLQASNIETNNSNDLYRNNLYSDSNAIHGASEYSLSAPIPAAESRESNSKSKDSALKPPAPPPPAGPSPRRASLQLGHDSTQALVRSIPPPPTSLSPRITSMKMCTSTDPPMAHVPVTISIPPPVAPGPPPRRGSLLNDHPQNQQPDVSTPTTISETPTSPLSTSAQYSLCLSSTKVQTVKSTHSSSQSDVLTTKSNPPLSPLSTPKDALNTTIAVPSSAANSPGTSSKSPSSYNIGSSGIKLPFKLPQRKSNSAIVSTTTSDDRFSYDAIYPDQGEKERSSISGTSELAPSGDNIPPNSRRLAGT